MNLGFFSETDPTVPKYRVYKQTLYHTINTHRETGRQSRIGLCQPIRRKILAIERLVESKIQGVTVILQQRREYDKYFTIPSKSGFKSIDRHINYAAASSGIKREKPQNLKLSKLFFSQAK